VIVVDTSALMAILLDEPYADACSRALYGEPNVIMSAITVAECLIVAAGRGGVEDMRRIIDEGGFAFDQVTEQIARQVARVYSLWGKGAHPARLNFADCFAYELAQRRNCALLFVGDDFRKTDVRSVL
jgi:ribonuclease VapC